MLKIPFSKTTKKYFQDLQIKKLCNSQGYSFSQIRFDLIKNQWQEWNKFYLPISVKNKTILDVGAGEGETALFYLFNGAKKIIAIEPDRASFLKLQENSKGKNIYPISSVFNLGYLKLFNFDFLKVDIEGYEEALLDCNLDFPVVAEVHSIPLANKFRAKGWRVIGAGLGDCAGFGSQFYGYWRC
jgi:SAM-dependent methyltransferase